MEATKVHKSAVTNAIVNFTLRQDLSYLPITGAITHLLTPLNFAASGADCVKNIINILCGCAVLGLV